MPKPTIEIDGARFDSLEGFWSEISTRIIPGAKWGRNFDAFNDILRGGFGTPVGGFTLRWVNFQRSKELLGYSETIRWFEQKLERCHPQNVDFVKEELERARRGEGPTVADIILGIIQIHAPGGNEEDDGIELELA
jgi:RNAse (barnase) inhibitor barstar